VARWDNVAPGPYPDDAGVRARQLDGPVDPPSRDRPPGRKRPRRDPGDPSCEACVNSATGSCEAHREFYFEYDPMDSLR
jgi:hypothetical protein